MSKLRFVLLTLCLAALIAALDQVVKGALRARLEPGDTVAILPGLDLVHVENSGAAFGLFSGAGLVLVPLSIGVILILALLLKGNRTLSTYVAPCSLIAGGGLGNLIDRVSHGSVTDYVDPILWPAFNFADVTIVVGVGLLAYLIYGESSQKGV